MSDLTYKFMRRKPIKIVDGIYFHHHSMDEIEEKVGYSNYNKVITCATKEPYEFEYHLEDFGIKYEDVTYFHLFVMLSCNESKLKFDEVEYTETEMTIKVMNLMFDAEFEIRQLVGNEEEKYPINNIVFYNNKTGGYIGRDNIHYLKSVLMKMYYIKPQKRRIASNEYAKELIKRDMARKSAEGIDNDIYSIITSLLWSENCSETQESIWSLTPYQIYSGYLTVEKLFNYAQTMQGYFTGNISTKDVNFNKIHWSAKIK